MKVLGKYLVKAYVTGSDRPRIAASFMTRTDAKAALDRCMEKISENLWKDSLDQKFYIEKNTKEYK